MSTKRVLELERAKERVKRLKAKIRQEEKRFASYVTGELGYHLRHLFQDVSRVSFFGYNNARIKVVFENGCELHIPPIGEPEVPQVFIDSVFCLSLYRNDGGQETQCHLESVMLPDSRMLHRLTTLAAVLPTARHIVRVVIPEWRANPPDAERLMTTRVLHWIVKQFGSLPLAVVIEEVLIKII